MKEFENDLMNVNDVKSLTKAMRGNGIQSISITDSNVIVGVNVYGLIENVPKELWCVENVSQWSYQIVTHLGNVEIVCNISKGTEEENVIARAGFKIPEEENSNESK